MAFPTKSPPLLPPRIPNLPALVIRFEMRSSATAIKSSYALLRFDLSAAWCQLGPNSPVVIHAVVIVIKHSHGIWMW